MEPPFSQTQRLKVLIVEDDKFLRDLMLQKLTREGFLVKAAIDGEEGIRTAVEEPPDLILLDLILPGIDGFEVMEHLRNDAKLSAVPVLVLSNLGQKEDIGRAHALGAADFMVKANFAPGEIVEKIKVVLKKRYL